jgi:Na+/phosphate symporter
MEEKEFNQRLHEIFKEMLSVLKSIRQGFWVENPTFLREAETKLSWILRSNLPFTEEIVKKETKDEFEKKYVTVLPNLQLIAIILRKLINEKKKKIESSLLFTDKAINEIKELYTLLQTQFDDTTDYILTRNSHLKMHIRTATESICQKANEYNTMHETRLIAGVCMPKASYSYITITACIKGVSMELSNFAEKL